ncbi:outer membrane beta-barrel protein [Dyella sp. LX-66]|uniref:outer membrane protein n=1 Tax=unclassified Dyella TaxID=2634549 RepID=UPI001BE05261|nr:MULTISPECIES: outer membrane beta-barrel protein [unclassified Dyella]MBT2117404.1 outer membrane beta-barrel protein [Dyella sp. LX-1]MBT2138468.1 outer membrane beta-barrel protein [Dyella sp. LX-66]
MRKRIISSLLLTAAVTATATAAPRAQGLYGTIKLFDVDRQLSDMTLTSPRVTHRTQDPKSTRSLNGSLGLGYQYQSPLRIELEYTLPSDARYVGRWAPFTANDNVLYTRTQRLMLNGYASWPLTRNLSLYGMLGAGVAVTTASGWQTRPERAFESHRNLRAAYAAGIGADLRIAEGMHLELGYRHVDLGRISTNPNLFDNRAHARDEQLKGHLREHNVYLGFRKML